ncbi:hypothetical protein XO10_08370 [Marinitoga sp. 1135]|uniref:Uncharacterized protein n=1 Tax=Marinitoga piezophila (strain DSM 14283 / JCM 11233 / KA3) TaxID=443254 RepID=H2J5E4_MARPK|nr:MULTISPECIES: hypothetical protein [Marinitoga]AEX86088.1 hypothetical protein Marpi_1699 [Marinitoga piezophila KA3]APT76507.1 hypothetical protein LN42_09055 [Marinitoga sp. 1137]NUU96274.1 hypothetical protein [Marinitoga sp. 1135]NUU98193.1 hypothetical protein [Marinitoga sp. 1138]
MIDDKIINEIVTACINDARLFSIVEEISKLNINERLKIRRKASMVLKKEKTVDKEALTFYFVITENGVAEEILRRINNERKENA